eukprot:jgi/Botrbrau1/11786/Bobra.0195s0110.1
MMLQHLAHKVYAWLPYALSNIDHREIRLKFGNAAFIAPVSRRRSFKIRRNLFRCSTFKNHGLRQPSSGLRPSQMLKRKLVSLGNENLDPSQRLRVFQWNTLADGLAQHGDFVKVHSKVLEWDYRAPLILEEIKYAQADILCLQEVNRFDEFFRPVLNQLGFSGYFWPKPCSPAEPYACPGDGCAVFFRQNRFALVAEPEGRPFHVPNSTKVGNQGMIHVQLYDKEAQVSFLVACTHLKAKGGAENELAREHQAVELLQRVEAACNLFPGANCSASTSPLVIICGDFNTTPNTAPCKVMEESRLGLISLWGVDTISPAAGGVNGVAEPEDIYTTWKFRSDGEVKRIIDYIWFSNDPRLQPVSRWGIPHPAEIGYDGLPSAQYPSDHLSVVCDFEIQCAGQKIPNICEM